MAKEENR